MDLRAIRMALVLGLVVVSATGVPRAAADWEVRRDPFDPNVIARYKAILARDPHDAALAKLLSMYKRFRSADLLAQEYADRGDWAALVVRGRLYRAANEPVRARIAWTTALVLRSGDARTWFALGELERATGHHARARLAFERARQHGTPAVAKRALLVLVELAAAAGDHAGSDGFHRELLARDPGNAKLWIAHGDAMMSAHRPDAALTSYTAARDRLALDPARQVEVIGRRADALVALERYDEALAELARAVALSPAYERETVDRTVEIHRRRHTLGELAQSWEKRWPRSTRRFLHWRVLADLYDELGDRAAAIAALEAATAKVAGELALERRLVALYDATGREDRALARYELLARRLPREPTFQLALAERYWPTRDAKAIATLERLAKTMDDDADVLAAVASLYSRWGRHDRAVAIYERAARRDPQYRVAIGEQYAMLEDRDRLGALVDRLAKARDAGAIARLGQVLLDRAMWPLAHDTFRIGVDIAPDDPARAAMWTGRASALEGLARWEDAAASAEQALKYTSKTDRKLRHQARHQLVRTVLRARSDSRWFTEWTEAFANDDVDAGYLISEYLAYRPCSTDPDLGCSLHELATTLEKLIVLVPDDPEPRKELARAFRRDRELERAIEVYERLIPLVPDQAKELAKRIAELRDDIRKRDEMAALHDDDLDPLPISHDAAIKRWRTGLRVGIGSGFSEDTGRLVRFSVVSTLALEEDRQTALVGRVDLAQRDSNEAAGVFGFGLGLASRVTMSRKWMVLAGIAGRAERYADAPNHGFAWQLAADFSVDLISRSTPFGFALHVDPRITGPFGAVTLLELAVELR